MKLEQQVCSLEWSQKLRKLGVKQESLFKWHSKIDEKGNSVHTELVYLPIKQMQQDVSAFTVAELGEMFPWVIEINVGKYKPKSNAYFLKMGKNIWDGRCFDIIYEWNEGRKSKNLYHVSDKSEADARAAMLCYLLENKLITI